MSRYVLVPAAGSGLRMGAETPKQYLPLLGRPVLYHSLALFCRHPAIDKVFVILSPDDRWFDQYQWPPSARLNVLYCGGSTRAKSVANGLDALSDQVAADDWMLVHDAARPCLSQTELDRLIETLDYDDVGGLLALPVSDTIKRGNAAMQSVATESRDNLWQAQTPQMFRYAKLRSALKASVASMPTDEAGAIENAGMQPRLVVGSSTNLKITYADDLGLAEMILEMREDG